MGDAQRHHRGAHRVDRGGIAGLVAFLREHGGAVEADLLRFYRADIRDLIHRSIELHEDHIISQLMYELGRYHKLAGLS